MRCQWCTAENSKGLKFCNQMRIAVWAELHKQLLNYLLSRNAGRSQGRHKPARFARAACVPSMFDSWRGESPRANLMEVKDSDAQGLPSRDGV